MSEEFVDQFSDGDLADPENFPEGAEVLGEITVVDVSETEPGAYRKFEKPLRDGRMEVPIIGLTIKAKRFKDGRDFGDANYYTTFTSEYWMGKSDTTSRHMLANLVCGILGIDKAEMASRSVKEAAQSCVGGKVSFAVGYRKYTSKQSGLEITIQQPTKLKAATAEEVALLM
jgi:hypothetical protein